MPQKQPPETTIVCWPFAEASGASTAGSGILTAAVAALQLKVAITARIARKERKARDISISLCSRMARCLNDAPPTPAPLRLETLTSADQPRNGEPSFMLGKLDSAVNG